MMSMLADKPVEQFAPSPEVLREIGAQERLNILASLQSGGTTTPKAAKPMADNAKTPEADTKITIDANEVIGDAPPPKPKD